MAVLNYLPKLKWGLGQAFQDSQHSGKTWKMREKFGKFDKSWKTLKTQENFLENQSTQGKPREKIYTSVKLVETVTCGS